MAKEITSTQNTHIKNLIQLRDKSRRRKEARKFLIEGVREISLAIQGGYEIEEFLVVNEIIESSTVENLKKIANATVETTFISKEVYSKLALRTTTEGILAISETKNHSLESIKFKNKNPLILVAEAPEKPGNIGALLRTVDAANIDAFILANPKTDLYNANIIRSSIGCVFTCQIGIGSTNQVIEFLQKHNIAMYCASLEAATVYTSINFTAPSAIIVGTEATGLSKEWTSNSNQNIIIPMNGVIDSLNVSVSAAILLFEATRQRNL